MLKAIKCKFNNWVDRVTGMDAVLATMKDLDRDVATLQNETRFLLHKVDVLTIELDALKAKGL